MSARILLFFLLAALLSPLRAADYVMDPGHTYASFEIDHLGFSTQRGRFNRSVGIIQYDPDAHTGSLDVSISVASLDTGLAARDEVLRGDAWFNAAGYPDILFRSQAFVFDGDKLVAVDGNLTMLAVVRPLRLEVTRFKCGLNLALRKRGCGADAQGVLLRSDFGLQNGIPFVGDEVRLRIQVEAYPP